MARTLICFIFSILTAFGALPNIAAFGDSLTAGYGADHSYPEYLQKQLDKDGYKYHVVNAGVSGDTSADGVERMKGVLELKPALAILEFGGNDGLRGMPVARTRDNLELMIQELRKAGAKVVLAGITLPRNYGPDYIRSFDQMYVDLAKKYKLARVPFLLQGVAMAGPGLMQKDGIHATNAGNQIVAATVYKAIAPLLKR